MSAALPSGLALTQATLPDLLARFGDWAVLGAAEDTTPEARLRRQVRWCRAGLDVVPLSPGAGASFEAVAALIADQAAALEAAHHRLRGKVQGVVQWDVPEAAGARPDQASGLGGRGWLQARAAQAAAQRGLEARFEARLRALLSSSCPGAWDLAAMAPGGGQRLRRAVLVPRAKLADFADALAARIAREAWTGGWQMVAPLPPLAFAGLAPPRQGDAA